MRRRTRCRAGCKSVGPATMPELRILDMAWIIGGTPNHTNWRTDAKLIMIAPRAWSVSRSTSTRCAKRVTQRRNHYATDSLHSTEESKLPRVANPSFWSSLIPKPFRRRSDPSEAAERAKRRQAGSGERRVGIIFMILGVLAGSNAIQIIAVKRQMLDYSRKTDARLELLREVVQRVKNGEDVDVKKILGTGEPEHEKEWEEVIKELEKPDTWWRRDDKKGKKGAGESEDRKPKVEACESPAQDQSDDASPGQASASSGPKSKFLM